LLAPSTARVGPAPFATSLAPLSRPVAHFAGLWRYRELVRNFVIRDLKARYKNSILGFFWSLANPLLMMVVFTIVGVALMGRDYREFPAFVLSGQLAWNWCSGCVIGGVNSITGNAHLIKKVAFPRQLLPLSMVLSNGVNFLLALIPLLLIATLVGKWPSPLLLLLPLVILIQIIFLTGLALFLGCLNVYFRDTEHIVEVLVLAWFFLTPVFYSVEELSAQYARLIYIFNPMASIISTYRLLFYYHALPDPLFVLRMSAQAVAVFVIGYLFFLRREADFGEEV
jgi:lipopolysaccharide transport system permease protein